MATDGTDVVVNSRLATDSNRRPPLSTKGLRLN